MNKMLFRNMEEYKHLRRKIEEQVRNEFDLWIDTFGIEYTECGGCKVSLVAENGDMIYFRFHDCKTANDIIGNLRKHLKGVNEC